MQVTQFLTDIGLAWRWQGGARGFLPGIDICDGVLLVDHQARASDLLHEAGHLATLPGQFRHRAQRDIGEVQRVLLASVDFTNPDGALQRAALQCSDTEATAWAWAAGVHLGLAPQDIIGDEDYGRSGRVVRQQLQMRQYAGIHGLAHAGFCAVRAGAYATARGLPAYPDLTRWLQKDF